MDTEKTFENDITAINASIADLSQQVAVLTERLDFLTQHHGDALTEFGQRLYTVEKTHGDALVAMGEQIQKLQQPARPLPAEQPAPQIRGEALHLPDGAYLGDTPSRYAAELETYRSQGGAFDPQDNSITYAHGDRARFHFFSLVSDVIRKEKIKGDMVELGVWRGDTATFLAKFSRRLEKTLYLLDTYEGFDARDLGPDEQHLSNAFSETSLDAVKQRVGMENVVFIKGYFPETSVHLPKNTSYCLVHLDADLEAPLAAGLAYFYPRMAPGGFLVIHDYMSMCWNGVVRAVDTFLADKPEYIIPVPDLAGSIVIRKSS